MSSKNKSTDLIDIYRLVHATHPVGTPLIDLDPKSPNNELETLRVLLIAYLPISQLSPENKHLGATFKNTEKKRERFMQDIDDKVMEHRKAEVESVLGKIYDTTDELLRNTMGPISEQRVGPLNLSLDELAFCDGMHGKGPTLPAESVNVVGRWFKKKAKPAPAEDNRIEPGVYVEHLESAHPEVFKKHPELKENISRNPLFLAKAYEAKHGRGQHASSTFSDF